jgi:hypothetical protein
MKKDLFGFSEKTHSINIWRSEYYHLEVGKQVSRKHLNCPLDHTALLLSLDLTIHLTFLISTTAKVEAKV